MTRIGVTQNKEDGIFPADWSNAWQKVQRDGETWFRIWSFEEYFTSEVLSRLEKVFKDEQEYTTWMNDVDIRVNIVNADRGVLVQDTTGTWYRIRIVNGTVISENA